jgi:oxygen-independent coproporphyrinogen-3 oxidase
MPANVPNFDQQLEKLSSKPSYDNRIATLYIHVPFCDQICSFCGFNKFLSPEDKKAAYVKALLQEMLIYSKLPHIKELDIQAIYLGGGTPNSLSAEQLNEILSFIPDHFNLNNDCEITCEGTPQNFTDERIAALKANKVFRVSAGVQTLNQAIREEHLHMRHNEEQILSFIEKISQNFENFNLDFIYNLPKQTKEIYHHDLDIALNSKATHLTIYPLVLLERTRFYSEYVKLKKHEIPTEENELEFFYLTLERMKQSDFKSYTIRDWSKPCKPCRYIYLNAKCHQVLAFGAGSHGYVAHTTYRNERNLEKYGEMTSQGLLPIDRQTLATREQLMQRFMVMGLRLFDLDMAVFDKKFNCHWQEIFGDKVQDMIDSGYLELKDNKLTHTYKGHVWANNIRTYFESEKGSSVGYTDSVGIDETGKSHYSKISRIKASADVEAHT